MTLLVKKKCNCIDSFLDQRKAVLEKMANSLPVIVTSGYIRISEVMKLDDFIDIEVTTSPTIEVSKDESGRYHKKQGEHQVLILPKNDGSFIRVSSGTTAACIKLAKTSSI